MRGTEEFPAPRPLLLSPLYNGTSCVNSLPHQATVTELMISLGLAVCSPEKPGHIYLKLFLYITDIRMRKKCIASFLNAFIPKISNIFTTFFF